MDSKSIILLALLSRRVYRVLPRACKLRIPVCISSKKGEKIVVEKKQVKTLQT